MTLRLFSNFAMIVAICRFFACASVVHLSPEARALNERGVTLLEKGKLDDAESSFLLALEFQPHHALTHVNVANVAIQRAQWQRAETHLRSALRINENLSSAWANLGVVFQAREKNNEAINAFENALRIDPGAAASRINIAKLYMQTNALSTARAHLMRLIQLFPHNTEGKEWLSYVEMHLNMIDSAQQRAEELLHNERKSPMANLVLGMAFVKKGKSDEAMKHLNQAANNSLLKSEAFLQITALHLKEGDYRNAKKSLDKVQQKKQTSYYLFSSLLALHSGHYELAAHHASLARKLGADAARVSEIRKLACAHTHAC